MDEQEDKHLCIVCNKTISGLLNYVIHRKNFCSNNKKSNIKGHVPKSRTEEIQFEGNISAREADETISHAQDHGKSSQPQFEESGMLPSDDMLPNDDRVTIPQEEDKDKIMNDEETTLSGYVDQIANDECNNVSDNGYVDPMDNDECNNDSDSHNENHYEDNSGEYICESESEDLTSSNANSKPDDVNDQSQLTEVLYFDEIPENIRNVLLGATQSFETDAEIADIKTDQETEIQDLLADNAEYGILSINVSGAPHKTFYANSGDSDTNRISVQDGYQTRHKRKAATAQINERHSYASGSHKKRLSLELGEESSKMCDLELNDYAKCTEHDKRIQHKNKASENNVPLKAEEYIVKVLGNSTEEIEEDMASNEIDQDGKSEDFSCCKLDESKIDADKSCSFECDHKSYNIIDVIIKMEKDNSDKDAKHQIELDITNGTHHCTVCDKWFSKMDKFISHLLSQFHKKQAVGKEKQYFSLIEKYHKLIIHQSQFQCEICSFFFNSNKNLVDHLRSASHRKQYRSVIGDVMCSLCRFRASSNQNLIYHLDTVSHVINVKKKNQKCVIKACKREKIGVRPRKRACRICPSEFSKRSSTKMHFQTAEHIRNKLDLEAVKEKLEDTVCEGLTEPGVDTEDANYENLINKEEDKMTSMFDEKKHEPKDLNDDEISEETFNNDDTCFDHSKNNIIDSSHKRSDVPNDYDTSIDSLFFSSETSPNLLQVKSNQAYSLKKASTCKYCPFETEDFNKMRPHYMKEHAEMATICEVCDIVFPQGRGYKLHVNCKDHQANIVKFGNETEGKFKCHVCDKKFAKEEYAKFHTAYYHYHLNTEDDVLRVNGNSVTRMKYAEFISKVDSAKKNELFTCPDCGSVVKQINMIGHLRLHTGEKPFKCNICTGAFVNSSSLRRHLITHFDRSEKICEICRETFKSQSGYKVHMDIHKAKMASPEKNHICHICGDAFYIKRKLRDHLKNHKEKSLKCEFPGCIWAFSTTNALKRHMLTHSTENPFICPTCGYSTKSEKYLKSHEKIHSKETFLKCEHCPYKTIQTTRLRRHMRIHLGTKPFKCPYCSYACNTHDNIRKHILETSLHKGLNVYPCKLCTYSTNCTKEFRTHILTQHTEVTAEELRGASLAVFTGLFNKKEDIQSASEGMEIFPCKERKTRRKIKPTEEDEEKDN